MPLEEAPALRVDDGRDGEVQLVDEALGDERLDQLDAAVDADVVAGQGFQVADDVGERSRTASASPHWW